LNLQTCAGFVQQAAREGAELVVLPENFAYLGPESQKLDKVETLGDVNAPIQGALAKMARESGAYVVGGGFPERSDDAERPHNTAVVFSPAGELVASYRKIHLFDIDLSDGTAFTESRNTKPGTDPVVATITGSSELTLGLSICYDIRFPELYRRLADLGADVVLAPAAFTAKTGKAHWHVLLRARAIESQMYVIAAAQSGKHTSCGRESYGHSLIIDPWGTILAELEDGVGFITADVSREHLADIRAQLPALKHRKL